MESVTTLCFLLTIISYIAAFDDIPYSDIPDHSWVKQDPRYSKFGFENIFSGLNLRVTDLLEGNYTHSDHDPAILKTGHVWGQIDVNSRKKREIADCGCKTIFQKVTPITVEYEGKTYPVITPASSEAQYFYEGICDSPDSSCGTYSSGVCIEDQDFRQNYVLVIDFDLPYWPPLRFLPISRPNHCTCTQH